MESGSHDPAATDAQGRTAYQLAATKEVRWVGVVCFRVCVLGCVCVFWGGAKGLWLSGQLQRLICLLVSPDVVIWCCDLMS